MMDITNPKFIANCSKLIDEKPEQFEAFKKSLDDIQEPIISKYETILIQLKKLATEQIDMYSADNVIIHEDER